MALSENTPVKQIIGDLFDLPVSNVHIYEGGACFLDANGDVVKTTSTGTLKFVGHAYAEKDNSGGSAGGARVRLRGPRPYRLEVPVAGVTGDSDADSDVYASDDATYTLTSTSNTKCGRVIRYTGSGTICEVEFYPFSAVS